MMVGDVIFFKKSTSLISRLIAFLTSSNYTHVGLIVEYDETTGIVTIIESDRFVNTRLNTFLIDEKKHVVYTTGEKTEEQLDRIMKFAFDSIGKKYDYFQIIGLMLSEITKGGRYFNNSNRFICSELIDLAYYSAGVERLTNYNLGNVTPQELISCYNFRVRS
jgi:Permuted papain-like amidase enzyme, YaeF/YiiX, C92 family